MVLAKMPIFVSRMASRVTGNIHDRKYSRPKFGNKINEILAARPPLRPGASPPKRPHVGPSAHLSFQPLTNPPFPHPIRAGAPRSLYWPYDHVAA